MAQSSYYHIFRTIDFSGDKLLIIKHESAKDFMIAKLEFNYREYEWQWMGTFTETEYPTFLRTVETVFTFDTRSFTIKLLDTSRLLRTFDLDGPKEDDYISDSDIYNTSNDAKFYAAVQDHATSLWEAAQETIQDPW